MNKMKTPKTNRVWWLEKSRQVMALLTCLLLLLTLSVSKNGRLLGHRLRAVAADTSAAAVRTLDDGAVVVSTERLAADVEGFAGATPVEIYLRDGRISDLRALPNDETPEFFERVLQSGLLRQYVGLSLDDALLLEVDAVSGATYSSTALSANVRRGLLYARQSELVAAAAPGFSAWLRPQLLCGVAVALLACVLPFFVRSRRYRLVQLALDVVVLGFWCGSFVSHVTLVSWAGSGFAWDSLPLSLLLLAAAFGLPLLGRKGHYCAWVCPMGALQELAGRCNPRQFTLSARWQKWTGRFRNWLWAVLMLLAWTGLWCDWMDYEVFGAFLFREAAVAVVATGAAFVLLSFFVARPYCRFVCPTGTLLRLSENLSSDKQ